MTKPIIGVTTFDSHREERPYVMVSTHYVQAILEAGGIPLLIPNQLTQADMDELLPRLGGVLFTGGGDIRTDLFNGEPHPKVGEVDDERDSLELPLMRRVAEEGRPFLGICRGFQVANVALGGTLYTHIPDQYPGALRHDWYPGIPRDTIAHEVRIEEESLVAEIVGKPILRVNSLHHQGIKDLAPALKAVGYAPDGLIEAVELPGHPFGLAVQWHPEWLTTQPEMRHLFRRFVEACK